MIIAGGFFFREEILASYPIIIAGALFFLALLPFFLMSPKKIGPYIPIIIGLFTLIKFVILGGSMCPPYSTFAFAFGASIGCLILSLAYIYKSRPSFGILAVLTMCNFVIIMSGLRVPSDYQKALNGEFMTKQDFMEKHSLKQQHP